LASVLSARFVRIVFVRFCDNVFWTMLTLTSPSRLGRPACYGSPFLYELPPRVLYFVKLRFCATFLNEQIFFPFLSATPSIARSTNRSPGAVSALLAVSGPYALQTASTTLFGSMASSRSQSRRLGILVQIPRHRELTRRLSPPFARSHPSLFIPAYKKVLTESPPLPLPVRHGRF